MGIENPILSFNLCKAQILTTVLAESFIETKRLPINLWFRILQRMRLRQSSYQEKRFCCFCPTSPFFPNFISAISRFSLFMPDQQSGAPTLRLYTGIATGPALAWLIECWLQGRDERFHASIERCPTLRSGFSQATLAPQKMVK